MPGVTAPRQAEPRPESVGSLHPDVGYKSSLRVEVSEEEIDMPIKMFREKSKYLVAIQFTGDNLAEIEEALRQHRTASVRSERGVVQFRRFKRAPWIRVTPQSWVVIRGENQFEKVLSPYTLATRYHCGDPVMRLRDALRGLMDAVQEGDAAAPLRARGEALDAIAAAEGV